MHKDEEILKKHDIHLTAMRLLVYGAMKNFDNTFSLNDLEIELDTVDKSTIFRVLKLFTGHHLVHEIEDGSGSKKYCLCHNDHVCHIDELHCHFYCEKCHKTYCFTNIPIPVIQVPKGFISESAEYLVRGICPDCQQHLH